MKQLRRIVTGIDLNRLLSPGAAPAMQEAAVTLAAGLAKPEQAFRDAVSAAKTETDFDARIELRILAAQMYLRVRIETQCDRALLAVQIAAHRARLTINRR